MGLAQNILIRCFDIFFSAVGLVILSPVLLVLLILGMFDTGLPLFLQKRVGMNKKSFTLIKFRTMQMDTKSVESHLVDSSRVTKYGRFLRKSKLDELPQLWNVLIGQMSLVGPRPCLFNQKELIAARENRGVLRVRPGITGLAQINHIDMSDPELLAKTDEVMINSFSLLKYFQYIIATLTGSGHGDRVKFD